MLYILKKRHNQHFNKKILALILKLRLVLTNFQGHKDTKILEENFEN